MPEGTATPPEIITVTTSVAACDSGDGPLGHPRVFLHLVDGKAVCPYCSRLFVLKEGAAPAGGH
ncbi:MAG TPA: zinc-finger domain-containing protein [Acetobacteraceae bacterium]|nr:zinc-finger domain-containing protein [Acetobacteraceae bacterium]